MELVIDEDKKKVYKEDNTIYTMIDMGSYIGHNNTPWYYAKSEAWYLMSMDENNGEDITHVESLVDDKGSYIRFIIDNKNIKRIILLNLGFVFNDFIVDKKAGLSYVALSGDVYSKEKVALEDYMKKPKPYKVDKTKLSGKIPSLDILKKYFDADEKLVNEIQNQKRLSLR